MLGLSAYFKFGLCNFWSLMVHLHVGNIVEEKRKKKCI